MMAIDVKTKGVSPSGVEVLEAGIGELIESADDYLAFKVSLGC